MKKIDPSAPVSQGDPRDQLLMLLSTLMINGPASSVNLRTGTQITGNIVAAQVWVRQYHNLEQI